MHYGIYCPTNCTPYMSASSRHKAETKPTSEHPFQTRYPCIPISDPFPYRNFQPVSSFSLGRYCFSVSFISYASGRIVLANVRKLFLSVLNPLVVLIYLARVFLARRRDVKRGRVFFLPDLLSTLAVIFLDLALLLVRLLGLNRVLV